MQPSRAPGLEARKREPAPPPAPLTAEQFFADRPADLSAAEEDLASAIQDFLVEWAENHADGRHPNMVHLGADPRIRQCKRLAVPPSIALRTWIEERMAGELEVGADDRGQAVLLPAGATAAGATEAAEAGEGFEDNGQWYNQPEAEPPQLIEDEGVENPPTPPQTVRSEVSEVLPPWSRP